MRNNLDTVELLSRTTSMKENLSRLMLILAVSSPRLKRAMKKLILVIGAEFGFVKWIDLTVFI